MNDGDITAILDRLVGSLDDEVGDWDDVLGRSSLHARAPEPSRPRRRPPWRSWRGLLLVGAAVAATALAVLGVTSLWRGGPTIVDRAAAAIVAPTAGQILYESITIRPSVSAPLSALPPPPRGHGAGGGVTHVRVWVDGSPPHRFRVTFDGSQPVDIGGKLGGVTGLSYAAADDVLDPVAFNSPISQSDLDPAAFIRKALTSGRAKLEGTTKIRGRAVLRIRVSSRLGGRLVPIALYFADAHTYRPVRVAILATTRPDPYRVGFPLISSSFLPAQLAFVFSHADRQYAFICDFAQYRYLARTAANRKLPNVRAMHPRAEVV